MSERTEPALTPKEWQELEADNAGGCVGFAYSGQMYVDDGLEVATISNRPAVAALCLHGQPFGFTWDDVDVLYEADVLCDSLATDRMGHLYKPGLLKLAGLLRDHRARVAALLPPRKVGGEPLGQ